MSNPVRQSLFTMDDARANRMKAEAAVTALDRILPGVQARAIVAQVPMPGHLITNDDEFAQSMQSVTAAVRDADVVFLLMDSREGRWLPALLAAANDKVAITAALDYESFVILRHGANSASAPVVDLPSTSADVTSMLAGDQLGCYFCMDVTAPANVGVCL